MRVKMSSRNNKVVVYVACGDKLRFLRNWCISLKGAFAEQLHQGSRSISAGESFPSLPLYASALMEPVK